MSFQKVKMNHSLMDTTIGQNNSFESFVTCKIADDLNKVKQKKLRDRENVLLGTIIKLTAKSQDQECMISKLKRELKDRTAEFELEIGLLNERIQLLESASEDSPADGKKLKALLKEQQRKFEEELRQMKASLEKEQRRKFEEELRQMKVSMEKELKALIVKNQELQREFEDRLAELETLKTTNENLVSSNDRMRQELAQCIKERLEPDGLASSTPMSQLHMEVEEEVVICSPIPQKRQRLQRNNTQKGPVKPARTAVLNKVHSVPTMMNDSPTGFMASSSMETNNNRTSGGGKMKSETSTSSGVANFIYSLRKSTRSKMTK